MDSPGRGALVVVGASLAGLRAVESARKAGFDGRITLVGEEVHLPYDRPPLSKEFLSAGAPIDHVPLCGRSEFADDYGVDVLLGEPATGLDLDARVVHTRERQISYSALIIATGVRARELRGTSGLAGVHVLRTLDDARSVRRALDDGARTVVIGAGFIGSEVASAARERGLRTTIVEALPAPMVRSVGPDLGPALASLHERNGTTLICGQEVTAIEGTGRVERVRLADGTSIEADLVVAGIGATPATEWLAGSGLPIDDGVVCDEHLRAGGADVYAAGDVARWHNPRFGTSMRVEHWSNAAEQGARAARNALFPAVVEPYRTVPYFWSDWYGSRIQFAGIADGDEHVVVSGDLTGERFVALYRRGDELSGALTLNGQRHIMRYRRLIARGANFDEALALAETMAYRHPTTRS